MCSLAGQLQSPEVSAQDSVTNKNITYIAQRQEYLPKWWTKQSKTGLSWTTRTCLIPLKSSSWEGNGDISRFEVSRLSKKKFKFLFIQIIFGNVLFPPFRTHLHIFCLFFLHLHIFYISTFRSLLIIVSSPASLFFLAFGLFPSEKYVSAYFEIENNFTLSLKFEGFQPQLTSSN